MKIIIARVEKMLFFKIQDKRIKFTGEFQVKNELTVFFTLFTVMNRGGKGYYHYYRILKFIENFQESG